MENKEEKYEEVAHFTKNNITYIIKQPISEPSPEELEKFYGVLGKVKYD
jgi:hypothetical protein